jgi:large subunit ribosomal protein L5
MALQSVTNVRATVSKSKRNVIEWGARAHKNVAVKCELEGENMYHFLSKVVELVLPRIKEWKGVSIESGDSTGNITFGFTPQQFTLFPEIEFNYDMYPPQMIPGCHITIHTTAILDREARLLLNAIGLPFDGKDLRG